MDVEIIKQGLKEILNEDISIRTSVQDLRRNVFLASSKAEEKESHVAKESKIAELSSEVEYFKHQLSLREQDLQEKLQNTEEEKKNLEAQLSDKQTELELLQEDLAQYKTAKDSLSAKNEELNRVSMENSHYAAKIRELVEHIAKLQDEKEAFVKETRFKVEKVEKVEKVVEDLQKENEALRAKLAIAEGRFSVLESDNVKLQEEKNSVLLKVDELTNNNNQLRNSENQLCLFIAGQDAEILELKSINGELQDANFEFINAHATLKLKTEEIIDVLREELTQLESFAATEIDNLKKENEELKSKAENVIKLELQTENSELKSLVEALRTIESNFESAQLHIAELEGAIGQINVLKDQAEEVIALQAKADVLLQEIERINAESQSMLLSYNEKEENMLAQLKDFQEKDQSATHINNEEYQALVAENTRLNTLTTMLKKRIAELEEQIVSLKHSADRAEENESRNAEVEKLTAEINVHIEAIQQLEENVNSLGEKVSVMSAQLKQTSIEKDSLFHECTKLKNEIQTAEEIYNKLMEELKSSHSSELEKLNNELVELKNHTGSEEELAELKAQLAALTTEKEELELAAQTNPGAEAKLVELQLLANELNAEKLKLEDTITDLKRELFKAEEKLESLETESKEQNEEFIEGLFKKIDLLNEKSQKLELQKEEVEMQIPALLAKIETLSEIIGSQNNISGKNEELGLEKDNNSPNLAGMLADSIKDKKSAKLKINELVREIDRCIAMLTTQS